MFKTRLLPIIWVALFLLTPFALSQQLTVTSETGKSVVLTRADLDSLPHLKVTTSPSGTPEMFEGVALKSVLERVGTTFGETLKGKRMASCLLVEAADGYRVVIALPELDPAFDAKQVLLAFMKDGKPSIKKRGRTAS